MPGPQTFRSLAQRARPSRALWAACAAACLASSGPGAGDGDALALRWDRLRAQVSAREDFLRSAAIEVFELPQAGVALARQPLLRTRAIFQRENERWTRWRLEPEEAGEAQAQADPTRAWIELCETRGPERIEVSDGRSLLSLARRAVTPAVWAGTWEAGGEGCSRQGALETAGLMTAGRWTGELLGGLTPLRADPLTANPDRWLWIASAPAPGGELDVHLLLVSEAARGLALRHVWQRMSSARLSAALALYRPGEPASWRGTGRVRDLVVEETVNVAGWPLPRRARCGPALAWLDYEALAGRAPAELFDTLSLPPECAGVQVSVTDRGTGLRLTLR